MAPSSRQSPLIDHVSDLDLEMRAVGRLGVRSARKVTDGGTMFLASPACTYTCTPPLIFLSFRCSHTLLFESSPYVCNSGSFCPNIYAFLKPVSSVAYVVIVFQPDTFFLICDEPVWICVLSLLLITNLTWHIITKATPSAQKNRWTRKFRDHGLNLFRTHGVSPQGNLLYLFIFFWLNIISKLCGQAVSKVTLPQTDGMYTNQSLHQTYTGLVKQH